MLKLVISKPADQFTATQKKAEEADAKKADGQNQKTITLTANG